MSKIYAGRATHWGLSRLLWGLMAPWQSLGHEASNKKAGGEPTPGNPGSCAWGRPQEIIGASSLPSGR